MESMRLVAVLPCYALDDLPKNQDETGCRAFHAAWTSLWHPSILSLSIVLPEWKRSDENSLNLENALVVGAESVLQNVDHPLRERLEVQGCRVVTAEEDRLSTLAAIARETEMDFSTVPTEIPLPAATEAEPANVDLWGEPRTSVKLDDFYALGFALLLVQHLTRKIHYSSNLDLVLIADQVRSAATAYLAGEAVEADRWLQSCFDQLSQERDRYFNQQAYLIDLTLLAKSTFGSALVEQLKQPRPLNVLSDARFSPPFAIPIRLPGKFCAVA